jgi:MFS family permease
MIPSSSPPTPGLQSNVRHLYWDVVWYGLLGGSTLAFLTVYVTRLGASSLQIGWINAVPAVVNLLLTLPAGHWLNGRPLIWVTFSSSVGQRLGYICLIFLPWLFSNQVEVWGIILVTLLMSIPGTILAIAFNAVLADTVPPELRGRVVGRRNALIAISLSLTTLGCGVILDQFIFPLNYQIVFSIGGFGGLMSSYHLSRLQSTSEPPVRIWRLLGDWSQPGIAHWPETIRQFVGLRFLTRMSGRTLLRIDLLRGAYGQFMLAYLVLFTCQYFAIPLFPQYYVNTLQLTDGEISLGSAFFYSTMLLASLLLARVSAQYGHRWVLIGGALLLGQYPLLLGLARDARLYWFASLVGGVVFAFMNGGLINRLMERVPADDRPAHMAWYNMVLNLGILIGSLTGSITGDWLGLRTTLFLSAGFRVLAGLLLWLWG